MRHHLPLRFLLPVLLLWSVLAPAALCDAAENRPTEARVIHVFVALCDNKHQWIVKVPEQLGNGQKPTGNLYWGAMYGLKTYFGRQKDWRLLSRSAPDTPSETSFLPSLFSGQLPAEDERRILERLVYKHASLNVYLVADAYDGKHIKAAVHDFLQACAGRLSSSVEVESGGKKISLAAGGRADLLCYVGHNGLMDFELRGYPTSTRNGKREAAVFACQSKSYFSGHLKKAGATGLALTTGNMAPEAYIVHALVNAWAARKTPAETREAVAAAYHKYQKCGLNAARRLFAGE